MGNCPECHNGRKRLGAIRVNLPRTDSYANVKTMDITTAEPGIALPARWSEATGKYNQAKEAG